MYLKSSPRPEELLGPSWNFQVTEGAFLNASPRYLLDSDGILCSRFANIKNKSVFEHIDTPLARGLMPRVVPEFSVEPTDAIDLLISNELV